MIQEKQIDINKIKQELLKRGIEFSDDKFFIMPESVTKAQDVLNEYSPDIYKILKGSNVPTTLVRQDNYTYLALRDAGIILPLILGIPFSIIASLIANWITSTFDNKSEVKLIFVKKDNNGEYKEITIEGNHQEIKGILSELKEM